MSPQEFYGSKVGEDPQDFIDELQKVTRIMDITLVESAEFAFF